MSVNRKYIFMQGFFWMLYCIAGSFLSLYLQSKGCSNQTIGLVAAVFSAVSVIVQPIIGRICDRSRRFTWKISLMGLLCIFFCLCILMLICPGQIAGVILTGLLMLIGNVMQPLVNGAMSYYQRKGEPINFGIARGTGSGLYALTAFLISNLAGICGTWVVPAAGLAIAVPFFFSLRQMPFDRTVSERPAVCMSAGHSFPRRYPAFMVMSAAFVLLGASQFLIETYLLQIIQSLDGGSRQLGIAMALQALVEIPVLFGFVWILKYFRSGTLMAAASLGYGLKAVCYVMARNIATVYLIQFTQMISFALYASASVYYVLDTMDNQDQITGQALMTSTMAAGRILGSLLGGYILDASGVSQMLRVNLLLTAAGIALAFLSRCLPAFEMQRKPS